MAKWFGLIWLVCLHIRFPNLFYAFFRSQFSFRNYSLLFRHISYFGTFPRDIHIHPIIYYVLEIAIKSQNETHVYVDAPKIMPTYIKTKSIANEWITINYKISKQNTSFIPPHRTGSLTSRGSDESKSRRVFGSLLRRHTSFGAPDNNARVYTTSHSTVSTLSQETTHEMK